MGIGDEVEILNIDSYYIDAPAKYYIHGRLYNCTGEDAKIVNKIGDRFVVNFKGCANDGNGRMQLPYKAKDLKLIKSKTYEIY